MILDKFVWATLGSRVVLHAVGSELALWLDPYLDLTWWMGHPVWSAIALLLLLVLAQAILGLVSHLIKRFLLVLVKSPYFLFQWVLRQAAARLQVPLPARFMQAQPAIDRSQSVQGQIAAILQQLEETKRIQDQLLQDLKQLVHTNPTLGQAPTKSTSAPTMK